MSAKTDSLRDLYLNVAGEEPITEPQEEGPSRDPIEAREADLEREISEFARQDGLEDALETPTAEG